MPLCAALSLLQEPLHYMGVRQKKTFWAERTVVGSGGGGGRGGGLLPLLRLNPLIESF